MNREKPRRRDHVTSETLADATLVLYDASTKMAYPLTTSGSRIWNACDGTRSVDTIVEELSAVYEAPEDVIRRDVDAFLEQLRGLQLLEMEDGGSQP